MTNAATDFSSALIPGPWHHDFVTANGCRFHVTTAGPQDRGIGDAGAPLIILLHSVPQFWWTWRHQITALAAAGYRVAAMDLRGAGASDKPPIGYDISTMVRDIAGVIRTLGARRAVVIGHGWGGVLAWSMAALQPAVVSAIGVLSAPHPARLNVSATRWLTRHGHRLLATAQLPTWPEKQLLNGTLLADAMLLGAHQPLHRETLETYLTVLRIPFAAHSAMQVVRHAVRYQWRPAGRRFLHGVRRPIAVPVYQLHGSADGFVRLDTVDIDAAALARTYRFDVIDGAGHFLTEEAPDEVTQALLAWLQAEVPLEAPREH